MCKCICVYACSWCTSRCDEIFLYYSSLLDSIRADRRALYIVVVTMKLATAEKTSTQATQIVYRLLVIDNGQ